MTITYEYRHLGKPCSVHRATEPANAPIGQASAEIAALREELAASYERIEELEDGLCGMIGLIILLNANSDIPKQVRWHMMLNHRLLAAEEML